MNHTHGAMGREHGLELYARVKEHRHSIKTRNARRAHFPMNPAHGIAKKLFTLLTESGGGVSSSERDLPESCCAANHRMDTSEVRTPLVSQLIFSCKACLSGQTGKHRLHPIGRTSTN